MKSTLKGESGSLNWLNKVIAASKIESGDYRVKDVLGCILSVIVDRNDVNHCY